MSLLLGLDCNSFLCNVKQINCRKEWSQDVNDMKRFNLLFHTLKLIKPFQQILTLNTNNKDGVQRLALFI
jgi:hypothetical protein